MIKKATKLISLLLSVVMLLGMLPMQVIADGIDRSLSKVSYPTGDSDGLILEFSSAGALEVFRTVYGGRVLGVTATGATLKEARANAYEATKWVDFENKYMRTDIGKAIDEV